MRPAERAAPGELAEDAPAFDQGQDSQRRVLQIKTNLDGVDYILRHHARAAQTGLDVPTSSLSASRPKTHKIHGFRWLVTCWTAGWPGALLADDMGLGKTFQALMFMAWLRCQERSGRRTILVVAPTALLINWQKEAIAHLAPQALTAH